MNVFDRDIPPPDTTIRPRLPRACREPQASQSCLTRPASVHAARHAASRSRPPGAGQGEGVGRPLLKSRAGQQPSTQMSVLFQTKSNFSGTF